MFPFSLPKLLGVLQTLLGIPIRTTATVRSKVDVSCAPRATITATCTARSRMNVICTIRSDT